MITTEEDFKIAFGNDIMSDIKDIMLTCLKNETKIQLIKKVLINQINYKIIVYKNLFIMLDLKNIFNDDLTCIVNFSFKKPEPKYVPFTFDDQELFKDKWIKSKLNEDNFKILAFNKNGFLSYTGRFATYQYFFDNYTFEDGTPFGKLIENYENLCN